MRFPEQVRSERLGAFVVPDFLFLVPVEEKNFLDSGLHSVALFFFRRTSAAGGSLSYKGPAYF